METLQPGTTDMLRDAVAHALSAENTLEIAGGGSKAGYGGPVEADYRLSTHALSGIVSYEPEELVLTARAGTTLAEIAAALSEANQRLAFEPPDWRALLGNEASEPTLGGIVAANMSGPARPRAGAARDHLLGLEMVTGRAELIRSGGKVVKNVTGYDLCKLLAGSFGTLGVMTELTVKTLPAPEKLRTVLIAGLSPEDAGAAMTAALNTPHDISAASYLPADIAACSAVGYVSKAGASVTALRIEGVGPSVLARCTALRERMATYGEIEELHFHNSRTLWAEIGDAAFFAVGDAPVWRISVPPVAGAAVIAVSGRKMAVEYYLDWGGGLIWLRPAPAPEDGGAGIIRAAIAECGGHATLVRGNTGLRRRVAVFQPPEPAVAALSGRVRAGFDPNGIFNPGRMFGAGG